MEFGRKTLDRNRITLDRPSTKNAITEKQLNYLRYLFMKKNICFPFESDQEAKMKISKRDASMMIDSLKKGKEVKINYL